MKCLLLRLDRELEQILHKSLQTAGESGVGIEPGLAEQMHKSLQESTQKMEMEGQTAVLLVSSFIRPWLARFVRHSIPDYMSWHTTKSLRIVKSRWFRPSVSVHNIMRDTMKIKRFFAADIRQAMRMVKEELGADAVIMSNRSVDGGVEIVAARDFDEQMIHNKLQNSSMKQQPTGPLKLKRSLKAKKLACRILKQKRNRLHVLSSSRKQGADEYGYSPDARRARTGSLPKRRTAIAAVAGIIDQYVGYAEKVQLRGTTRTNKGNKPAKQLGAAK